MIWLRFFLVFLSIALATATWSQTESARIALVVGNAAYSDVSSLDNPGNDAGLIGAVLEESGFDVTFLFDASKSEFETALVNFGRALRDNGPDTVGLFYFAGHGVQSLGKNYLLPVDSVLRDAADLDLAAVEADVVLRQMESAKNRTNIVILDACRNNPFLTLDGLEEDGLAEMKASQGTFLSYATGPGDVALDGLGRHSPFSAALADAMKAPGAPIEQVFKTVRIQVVEETRGIQTPWDTSLLTTNFSFFAEDHSDDENEATALWARIQDSGDAQAITRFLRTHPTSDEAADALLALQALLETPSASDNASTIRAASTAQADNAADRALFDVALQSGKPADYSAYLTTYPSGLYADLARLELEARK